MPAEANRSFENLLLLCIEHAYEIDETPERFPADTLRDWKAAQLAEYDRLQRSWPISDDEAAEVLDASEMFDSLHAPSTVELVRRIEALRLIAERTRRDTRAWAGRWQQLKEHVGRAMTAWDEDGNLLYAEPAEVEVRPIRDGIRAALATARTEVTPAAEAAQVELAAVRVTRTQVKPWCDALDRAIAGVIEAASTWTGGHDPAADTAFDAALSALNASIADLVRASRGEPVPMPKPPSMVSEPAPADPLAEHRKLLDKARPFHRVDHRAYDPELRERVAEASRYAASLPPTMSFLGVGVDTTAALAVAVAGNADESDLLKLIERDRQRLPLCAAATLLQETARHGDEESAPVVAAREELRRLWWETDWADETTWIDNDVNGRSMMYAFARVTSDDEVRDRLTQALKSNPGLLGPLVISCAGWAENLDWRTWATVGFDRRYCEIPPWLPTKALKALADDPASDDQELLDALLRSALDASD